MESFRHVASPGLSLAARPVHSPLKPTTRARAGLPPRLSAERGVWAARGHGQHRAGHPVAESRGGGAEQQVLEQAVSVASR